MEQFSPQMGQTGRFNRSEYADRFPLTPEQQEKKRLRRDGNYIGGMMLLLAAAMQFTFVLLCGLLVLWGVLPARQISMEFLGLDNTTYLLLYAGVYSFAMAVPAILLSLMCGRRYFPLSPAAKMNGGDAFFGLLGAMAVCMAANYVAAYVAAFLTQFGLKMPEMPEMLERTPESLLLNLLVMAVLPALLEELVFRGYVLRTLRPYGDWFAVVISALLFGLMHGNILQIPFALIVGLVLGWLYVMTNNIWLSVAVHFCNNALSVLLDYGTFDMSEARQGVCYAVVMGAVLLVGMGALIVLAVRRSALFRRLPVKSRLTTGERLGTLLRSPALVIALLVFLLLMILEALL